MSEGHITNLVKTLDKEIENARSLSHQDRELLQDLRRDIDKVLATSPASRSKSDTAVIDRLRGAPERFEASHPGLTGVLANIIDSLVKLGF